MKNNRKFLIGMFTVVLVILVACENSSDESSAASGNQSQNNNSTQNTNDDSNADLTTENDSNIDNTNTDTIDTENNDTNEKVDSPNNKKEEDSSTNNTASLKEEYLQKLNDTKKEIDEIRKNSEDEITYALKKVEGDRYDVWDGLLNEIYGVLKKQLPSEEMDQLRKEQRKWIDYRDSTAKEASLKYKGGTMEQLEYVTVQNNLTEGRCFELVEDYMK